MDQWLLVPTGSKVDCQFALGGDFEVGAAAVNGFEEVVDASEGIA